MRVVGGTAKGTKLLAVPGDTTRPVLDRVKTSLFDILRPSLSQVSLFLDLFAGSGSVGIEALSQGDGRAIFLDLEEAAVKTIKANLDKTRFSTRAEVRRSDAFGYLRKVKKVFDLIYVAPPQYEGLWLEALKLIAERPQLLSPSGRVVVQIDPKEREGFSSATLQLFDERKYGNTLLLFYRKTTTDH
ncbi:MAG: 16S rRNA (guanine(966)-N(2))-methyltransferase RsmD [Bdellovibrionales bacterium]|nr:16S rRNA (guanine(966)-N(2))-methyltransferase RsmD [Bdellovibrionales bacterium]